MSINFDLKNIDAFIELITDLVFFKNLNGQYIHCNNSFLNFIGKNREDVINKTDFDLFSNENAIQFRKNDKAVLLGTKPDNFEEVLKKEMGDNIYFNTSKQSFCDKEGTKLGVFCIAQDTTLKKQYEFIYKDNEQILEYIAVHNDLPTVLNEIVYLAEQRIANSKCSILLLDKNKQCLINGSAPSLPDFYNDAVDGIEIGEKVGSCGSAACKQQRVIVENINQHENWKTYLPLTQRANLHACWSEPIFSSNDEILGTFAIYHHKPKKPSVFELKLISSYAHQASVAIEKEYNQRIIKEKELQLLEQTKKTNEKLTKRENELSQLFSNTQVGLMYITRERKLIKSNQRLADIFGYANPEEMLGISMLKLHLTKQRFNEFGKTNFEALKEKEKFNIEYQLCKKDGSSLWCELSGKALDVNIPADLSKGVLWTINDISKRKKLEEKVKERTKEIEYKNIQLKELIVKDYLTGLSNRAKLDEVLAEQLKHAMRYQSIFGVILLDIDFFKMVNDNYGHQAGDTTLREFANILAENYRETDTVGRWGGEEFLIVVQNINKHDIIKLADKIREKIAIYDFSIVKHCTVSIGTAVYHSGDKVNELIGRADDALYKAKKNGRNQVRYL